MLKILFICTGNTCRSPMAEILLRERVRQAGLADKIQVTSAGLAANGGDPASAGAQSAMQTRGLDLSRHTSGQITSQQAAEADLILTMTAAHKRAILTSGAVVTAKVYTLAEYAGSHSDIADPFGCTAEIYEAAAEEIDDLLDVIWQKIVDLAGKNSYDGEIDG